MKNSKTIITYSELYGKEILKSDIIKEISKLDVQNALMIINRLLNDLDKQVDYKIIYYYSKACNSSINAKDYYNSDYYLFCKQGLYYLTKWIFAYGNLSNKKNISIIDDTINILDLTLKVSDFLDKDNINPLVYLHKNLYFNSKRNIKNDICRSIYIYNDLATDKNLYNIKEYIDINNDFYNKYKYTIEEYIVTIYILLNLHFSENVKYKIVSIKNYIKFIDINIKSKIESIINENSHKIEEYSKWALQSIDNSWNYEEIVKYPIIKFDEDRIISLDKNLIENKLFESLYYKIIDIYEGKQRKKAIAFFGRPFEIYVGKLAEFCASQSSLGYKYINEFEFGPKNNYKSSDAYIVLDNRIVIIEAKATRPIRDTFISSDVDNIKKAVDKFYINPIIEANKAYVRIMEESSHYKEQFESFEEIYIVSVSLGNVPYVQEVKEIVDLKLKNNLNDKVKGYCNFTIEEYEFLCTLMANNIDIIEILKKYNDGDDSINLFNSVKNEYLTLKNSFHTNKFKEIANRMGKIIFNKDIKIN